MATLYKLDKKTKDEIIETVRRVAIEILEGPKENWMTADEVSKMFPFFSKYWLKDYGYLLPRKHVIVEDKDGNKVTGRWYYSRNRLLRMVRENDTLYFKDIKQKD